MFILRRKLKNSQFVLFYKYVPFKRIKYTNCHSISTIAIKLIGSENSGIICKTDQ